MFATSQQVAEVHLHALQASGRQSDAQLTCITQLMSGRHLPLPTTKDGLLAG